MKVLDILEKKIEFVNEQNGLEKKFKLPKMIISGSLNKDMFNKVHEYYSTSFANNKECIPDILDITEMSLFDKNKYYIENENNFFIIEYYDDKTLEVLRLLNHYNLQNKTFLFIEKDSICKRENEIINNFKNTYYNTVKDSMIENVLKVIEFDYVKYSVDEWYNDIILELEKYKKSYDDDIQYLNLQYKSEKYLKKLNLLFYTAINNNRILDEYDSYNRLALPDAIDKSIKHSAKKVVNEFITLCTECDDLCECSNEFRKVQKDIIKEFYKKILVFKEKDFKNREDIENEWLVQEYDFKSKEFIISNKELVSKSELDNISNYKNFEDTTESLWLKEKTVNFYSTR